MCQMRPIHVSNETLHAASACQMRPIHEKRHLRKCQTRPKCVKKAYTQTFGAEETYVHQKRPAHQKRPTHRPTLSPHTMACLDERDLGVHFNAQERAVRSDEPPRTLQNLVVVVGLAV